MVEMHLRSDINFRELWNELGECYESADIRCIATKDNEEWKNLMLVVFVSRKGKEELEKEAKQDYLHLSNLKVTEIEELGIFHEIIDADKLPDYVKQIENRKIILNHQLINLRGGEGDGRLTTHRRTLKIGEYAEYPVVNIEFYANSSIISEGIRNKLLSLGLLEGIDEVSSLWLKLPFIEGTSIESIVVFPVYFNLLDFSIQEGRNFSVKFKVDKNLRPKLRLTLALRRETEGSSITLENKVFEPDEFFYIPPEEDFLICEAIYTFTTIPSLNDEIYFSLSSNLGTFTRERTSIETLLKRAEFKEPFLKFFTNFLDIGEFKKILQAEEALFIKSSRKSNQSLEFQRAVSYLLSLMNFKVIEFGDTKYNVVKRKDGSDIADVDLIAQDLETKNLYVVQCKIAPPKPNDIDKFANAVNELRSYGFHVVLGQNSFNP